MKIKVLNNGGFDATREPDSFPIEFYSDNSFILPDNNNILEICGKDLADAGLLIEGISSTHWSFSIGDECEIIEE